MSSTEKTKQKRQQQQDIPKDVLDVLKTSKIGYLSVRSEKGDLYTYPVAYLFSGMQLYTMTPVSAAKLKFMRANPNVSFLVENKGLTLGAIGAMIQGDAKVFSIAKTITNILSVGPNMGKYAKKYPEQFFFYARGKYLPDERKLYKYRFIRINPSKILYWVGYEFGKYFPARGSKPDTPGGLENASDDEKMDAFASLLDSADKEFGEEGGPPSSLSSAEWTSRADDAVEKGIITPEELGTISSYRSFLRIASSESAVGPGVSKGEKSLLDKWKKKNKQQPEQDQ